MPHAAREIEIKLAIGNAASARRLLRQTGYRVSRRRVFESNTVFDTPDLAMRRASTLLRIRQAGAISTVTYKGPPLVAKHKSREELELRIADAPALAAIVERLGLHPVFRYEKFRTEYRQPDGAGVAMLDETPIGLYLELEGPARWIDRSARALGFSAKDYITGSYARLYLEWCGQRGVTPGNMVFQSGRVHRAKA